MLTVAESFAIPRQDVDLAVFDERFVDCLTASARGAGCVNVSALVPSHVQFIVRTGLHSDIIPVKVVDKRSGVYVDLNAYHWCGDRYLTTKFYSHLEWPRRDVLPLAPCAFEGLEAPCPRRPVAVARAIYNNLDVPKKYQTKYGARFNRNVAAFERAWELEREAERRNASQS